MKKYQIWERTEEYLANLNQNSLRVYDTCEVSGNRFAILVNDETKQAFEAVWDGDHWNTDFSYSCLEADSFDVAGSLDFNGCREAGYNFEE